MRVLPSTDRYFPIGLSRLVQLTQYWPLSGRRGSESRRLRNRRGALGSGREVSRQAKHAEPTLQLLAILRPGLDVTIYSLHIDVNPRFGEQAATKALELLAEWKAAPAERAGRSRSIVVYLHGLKQLRVLDERLRFTSRRFGAGEGLSSYGKPRVTSRSVTELAKLALD